MLDPQMKRTLFIAFVAVLIIGFIPYVIAVSSYRGSTGSIDGKQMYTLVDKTHFNCFKIAVYPTMLKSSFRSTKNVIYYNEMPIIFPDNNDCAIIDATGSISFRVTSDADYVTTTEWGSEIYGIFYRVPHFKSVQRERPLSTIYIK